MSAVDMIDHYLEEKHCTLWGRGYDTVDPTSRHKAAVWFRDQIEEFYSFNSGIPVQIKDPDIDIDHLLLENREAAAEIERLRHLLHDREGTSRLQRRPWVKEGTRHA